MSLFGTNEDKIRGENTANLPMVPFILWVLGFVGWVILVLELVLEVLAVAPLWVIARGSQFTGDKRSQSSVNQEASPDASRQDEGSKSGG